MYLYRVVFLTLISLDVLSSEVAVAAEMNLDRTLEKLAASMLRECPSLRGSERTSEARKRLVGEFEKLKADSISSGHLKKIRRSKVDYQAFAWTRIVEKYECGDFKDPKMLFLLKKSKAEKMRGEEHYVVYRLMRSYYDLKLEERTVASKKDLSQLGKLYTAYLKEHGKPPENLENLQQDLAKRIGMNPLTGIEAPWIYIGQGPAEIRGPNKYRVIAYAPFASGKDLAYKWVVYKGGQLGTWKTDTLLEAVKRMERDNLAALQQQVDAEQKPKESKPKVSAKPLVVAKKESKARAKPKIKITISELW
ncbi:MAG: hypothetical protein ABGY95_11820 [Rubritalea sp.]|uniref:hypothetical protein n=1 Tax=Rubritalea sp. TaxID=2109375 RepID=UPI0032428431